MSWAWNKIVDVEIYKVQVMWDTTFVRLCWEIIKKNGFIKFEQALSLSALLLW